MKALVYRGPRALAVEETDRPGILPHEVESSGA